MPRIKRFELHAVDLPFKTPFKHAAAENVREVFRERFETLADIQKQLFGQKVKERFFGHPHCAH